jgi:hypothetical protein
MKKYILFYFFVFQVTTYAQYNTISDASFKNRLIALDIDSGNPGKKTVASNTVLATVLETENTNFSINSKATNDLTINRLYFLRSQLKKLDVSQNIDLDYFVFSNKQLVFVHVQKKLKWLDKANLPIS